MDCRGDLTISNPESSVSTDVSREEWVDCRGDLTISNPESSVSTDVSREEWVGCRGDLTISNPESSVSTDVSREEWVDCRGDLTISNPESSVSTDVSREEWVGCRGNLAISTPLWMLGPNHLAVPLPRESSPPSVPVAVAWLSPKTATEYGVRGRTRSVVGCRAGLNKSNCAAVNGRPMELAKRLRLGHLAGGLERQVRSSGASLSGQLVSPLGAALHAAGTEMEKLEKELFQAGTPRFARHKEGSTQVRYRR